MMQSPRYSRGGARGEYERARAPDAPRTFFGSAAAAAATIPTHRAAAAAGAGAVRAR